MKFHGSYSTRDLFNNHFRAKCNSNEYSSDPYVQLYRGIQFFIKCDYANGKEYISWASDKQCDHEIFFQVLALHWHGYYKEQICSLNVLIDADGRLGERYYPLQHIYLNYVFKLYFFDIIVQKELSIGVSTCTYSPLTNIYIINLQ